MSDDGFDEELGNRWIWKIRNRLWRENKNFLCVVVGEPGSGKSYSALSIASSVAKNFRDEAFIDYVVLNSLEFMSLINKGRVQKGDCVVADEWGVAMGAREWWSQPNIVLSQILQTFRHKNLAVFFTVPDLSFVDVAARKLFHCLLMTHRIDHERQLATLKVYEIQHNSKVGKTYYKHPRFMDEHGRMVKMTSITVHKPEEWMCRIYEAKKEAFTQNLNLEAERKIRAAIEANKPQESQADMIQRVSNEVIKNKEKYLKQYGGRKYIDADLLRKSFNLSERISKIVKKQVENTSTEHTSV